MELHGFTVDVHYLQAWEICLRNKLHQFLMLRFGADWAIGNERFLRALKDGDARRLMETVERQMQRRKGSIAPAAVVADLSAGFWVSLLSKSYDVPFAWRRNKMQIFPHHSEIDMRQAWRTCDRLLKLRNRIAHHEPVFRMPLADLQNDMQAIVAAMCMGTLAYAEATSSFATVWQQRPDCLKASAVDMR